ncbi:MAG: hypothetical protein JXM70_31140 [Pirellulales bacterium]|nr:hypothetical protein [Pirellulales bacterium]
MVMEYKANPTNKPAMIAGGIAFLVSAVVAFLVVQHFFAVPSSMGELPINPQVNAANFSKIALGMTREQINAILGEPHVEEWGEKIFLDEMPTAEGVVFPNLKVYKGYYGSDIKVLYNDKTHEVTNCGGRCNRFAADTIGSLPPKSPDEPSPGKYVTEENFSKIKPGMTSQEVKEIMGNCQEQGHGGKRYSIFARFGGEPIVEAGSYVRAGIVADRSVSMPDGSDGDTKAITEGWVKLPEVAQKLGCPVNALPTFRMLHQGNCSVSMSQHNRNIYRGPEGKAIVIWFDKKGGPAVARTFYDCDVSTTLHLEAIPELSAKAELSDLSGALGGFSSNWGSKRLLPMTVARTWTDSTGKHSTEAKFVEVADGKVKLCKADGSFSLLPIDRLSTADQQWIEQWFGLPAQ